MAKALLFVLLLICTTLRAEEYLIGAESDWYPYTALRDGQVTGMSAQIVREAFAAAQVPVKLVAYPYARCMYLAERGELAGCFNTAWRDDLQQRFLLSPALFQAEILLWRRQQDADPLDDLSRLAGRRVAMVIGYEYGPRLDTRQDLQRIPVRQELSAFDMLDRGRVDFVPAYRGTAEQLFRDYPRLRGHFVPVASLYQPTLHLSFSRRTKNAERLRERFTQGLQQLHANGRYAQILQQWGAEEDAPREAGKPQA